MTNDTTRLIKESEGVFERDSQDLDPGRHVDMISKITCHSGLGNCDKLSWLLAHHFRKVGNREKARDHFQIAVNLNPEKIDYRIDFAEQLAADGLDSDAYSEFSKILELDRDHLGANYGKCLIELKVGDFDNAHLSADRCLNTNPQHEWSLYAMAMSWKGLGNDKLALTFSGQLCDRFPDEARYWGLHARFLMEQKDRESLTGSVKAYSRAILLSPKNARYLIGRIMTNYELNSFQECSFDLCQVKELSLTDSQRITVDSLTSIIAGKQG